ncbi:MAG: hypothetical protein ACREEV_09650, partial [Dongiaceae bacterium]
MFRDGKLLRYFIYASALTLSLTGGQLYVELGVSWTSGPETSATGIADVLFGLLISAAYAIA